MDGGDNLMHTLISRKDVTGRLNPCLEILVPFINLIMIFQVSTKIVTWYRRRRYSSLAELVEDFERDQIAGSSFRRSTAPQATRGDRRNFSGWSIGEASSDNQNNRGYQMTNGEPMTERWIPTSSSANPVRMWVGGVPTTVDQRNFSGLNTGGLAFNQNNPGTQMRHAESWIGSGMSTSSSANPGARQSPVSMWDEENRDASDYNWMVDRDFACRCNNGRQGIAACVCHQAQGETVIEQVPSESDRRSSGKRKAPEEYSVNLSYRASSSGSQLPENAWRMASGSQNPSASFRVPPPVTSIFQHNTPELLDSRSGLGIGPASDLHPPLYSPEHIESTYRNIRLRTSASYQQDSTPHKTPGTSLTIGQPEVVQAHSVTGRPQISRTNTHGVKRVARYTDHRVSVSSSISSAPRERFAPIQGHMASQWMADPNVVFQQQHHDPRPPAANADVRDRLSQDDDDDEADNGADEEEGVVTPGYLPRLVRRRDGTVWIELVDSFGYGDLLQPEDQIGNAEIGLTEEDVAQHLKRRRHPSLRMGATSSEVSPCCICQEEFSDGEEIGMLDCGHDFHSGCI